MSSHTAPNLLVAPTVAAVLLLVGCGTGPASQPGATGNASAPAATSEPPTAGTGETPPPKVDAVSIPGLVSYDSRFSVDETVRRLSDALSAAGMVVATVDHAANAASVGQQLRPTVLVIGGNPAAGTPLMADQQEAGIDLPQKFLVWEDDAGTVRLAYNDATYLAELADVDPAVAQGLAGASARLAAQATGSKRPVGTGQAAAGADDYLRERDSVSDVPSTLQRLKDSLGAQGLRPVAVVDHAQGAETVGATLRPTTVLLVGNPQVGTPLIQAAQTVGIDLPVRFLVWQEEGATHVAHPDIARLAKRHGIPGDDPAVQRITRAASMFAAAAAGRSG